MDTAVALPLITFLLGLWGGHYFSLLRDRRKEYNEVADAVRKHVMTERPEALYLCASPSAFEIDQLQRLTAWWRRPRLRAAIKRYSDAKESYGQTDCGSTYQDDVSEAAAAVQALLAAIHRR